MTEDGKVEAAEEPGIASQGGYYVFSILLDHALGRWLAEHRYNDVSAVLLPMYSSSVMMVRNGELLLRSLLLSWYS